VCGPMSAMCQKRTSLDLYSITLSARPISVLGIIRPSVLAVLRLMTSSRLVGSTTGSSAGLAEAEIAAIGV
jgi:hypothetical protein